NGVHKPGDVILGGLFEVHYTSVFPELTFTSEPHQLSCQGFDTPGFRHAMTMAFAIDEINKNSNLLTNVTLGYSLYDNCATLVIGFSAALSLASGREEQFLLQDTCLGTPPVLGIVGDSISTFSIATSDVIGLFRLPIVSYFATCSCLSNRGRFPSFFRTIPSDAFQVRAMIQILKRFGWTWAGLLVSDDDYGLHVARSFQLDLTQSGEGCLAYTEILPWGDNPAELKRIIEVMKKSTARVVIVFAHRIHMIQLMEEVVRQNVTGLQWMASEAWTAATVLQTPRLMPYLGGTLGIAIRRGEIPGLRDFLLRIHPDLYDNENFGHSLVRQFWEHTFQCRFAPPPAGWVEAGGEVCTGDEDLESVETELLDVSNLRPEYNIYKAVYSLAYALDD
ncbi:extracellular calcium-sensing receptor-like, partial [Plectropomus leopardus]|uniref:extracellular calcium-sensing receptor-like n=1 Tax=Plectropomus leopardus TaxID=160734 RepID=UPI001C4DA7DA